jgi:putative serine protease PepD
MSENHDNPELVNHVIDIPGAEAEAAAASESDVHTTEVDDVAAAVSKSDVDATKAADVFSESPPALEVRMPMEMPAAVSSTYGGTFAYATPAASYATPTQIAGAPADLSKPRMSQRVLPLALVALIAGVLGGVVGAQVSTTDNGSGVVATVDQSDSFQQLPSSSSHSLGTIARIAAAVLPTVVSVITTSPTGGGTGSGEIIKSGAKTSFVLTNNHVILDVAQSGGTIAVLFQDGTQVDATLVGRDPSYDLAVLKINRGRLPVIPFGNSDSVVVGDPVVAVGSPLGLTGTVTSGIVSALHRPVTTNPSGVATEESFISAIQTDAAINPGNSGGPLVDSSGRMVGVNSAIATLGQGSGGQTGNIGVGFSIPIGQARRVADEIIRTGHSSYPVIGVTLDSTYSGRGARIRTIAAGGPAAAAGMRVGDVITRVNGRYMADLESVITSIRSNAPGDKVELLVDRSGRTSTITVTLDSRRSMG